MGKEEKKVVEGFGVSAEEEQLTPEELKKKTKKFRKNLRKINANGSLIISIVLAVVLAALLALQNVVIMSVAGGNENFVIVIFNLLLGVVGGTIVISVALLIYFVICIIGILSRRNLTGIIIFTVQIALFAIAIYILSVNLSVNI